jgi:hypothetical protein
MVARSLYISVKQSTRSDVVAPEVNEVWQRLFRFEDSVWRFKARFLQAFMDRARLRAGSLP